MVRFLLSMKCLSFLLALCCLVTAAGAAISDPVHVQQGLISGIPGKNPEIRVYRGIPFAMPPVGNLRWKAPQPPASWNHVRDASTFGNECPQDELSTGQYGGDEDCLTLNIFTSQSPATQPQPVMVF